MPSAPRLTEANRDADAVAGAERPRRDESIRAGQSSHDVAKPMRLSGTLCSSLTVGRRLAKPWSAEFAR